MTRYCENVNLKTSGNVPFVYEFEPNAHDDGDCRKADHTIRFEDGSWLGLHGSYQFHPYTDAEVIAFVEEHLDKRERENKVISHKTSWFRYYRFGPIEITLRRKNAPKHVKSGIRRVPLGYLPWPCR